jgi:hypothetical protein
MATNTVKGHVHNILEKLALHTRLQIAAHARTRQTEAGSPSAARSLNGIGPQRRLPTQTNRSLFHPLEL